MQLYKIADEFQNILQETDEFGEIDAALLDKLEAVSQAVEAKSIAVACYIKNLEAERNSIEVARKEMAARELQLDKKVEFFTGYLKENMERCGISEISSSPYFAIKIKKCPVAVSVLCEEVIPEKYWKRKEVLSLDRVLIKEDINAGIEIDGAELKQNTRLEIR